MQAKTKQHWRAVLNDEMEGAKAASEGQYLGRMSVNTDECAWSGINVWGRTEWFE